MRGFGERLYVIEGPVVRDLGMPFDTRMTVAVLDDGSLWIESPVPLPYDQLRELTEVGPVAHLVSNTPRHQWRLDAWHSLFPSADLWAARSTLATLKRSRLPVATLGDTPPAAWAAAFDQIPIKGSRIIEEVWFRHRPSGTLIVGDLIQVHELRPGSPFGNALKRYGGVAAPEGGTAIDIKASFWDRSALRASVEHVLDLEFDKLVLAHGPCLTEDAKPFVERAMAWVRA